ncbi:two-component system, sensor histidine kinase YesM [Paenibacillus sp. yr247]|uniref:sensor histidine kinase n=1 Tax=Paenibacillus sp. yr247 TaxID=1761880 RepID=UPI000881C801|nr:histidine kinase [Paenibacillus sp. yr247]SDN97074.1 two-component system, sensor histidine kinase YesM [Paenibacillus sp. yr247]
MRENSVLGLRFQTKIMLVFVVIVFVPLTAILVTIGFKAVNEIQDSHISYMRQLNEQINRSMDIIIKDAERASLLHISDVKLAEVLMKEYKQPPLEYAEDARTITQAIIHASQLNPYILSVSFHGKNGNIYSSAGSTEDYNIYNQHQTIDWMERLKKVKNGRFVTNVYQGSYKPLISEAKMLLSMPSMEPIGYVWINLDFYSIKDALHEKLKANKPNGFLIVQEGTVLYNTNYEDIWFDKAMGKILQNLEEKRTGTNENIFKVKTGGKELLFVASRNDTMNWDMVQFLPVSEIQSSFNQYINFYTVSTVFLLLAALLSGGIMSLRMLKPINRLIEGMKQVANGHLNVIKFEDDRRDEMGLLIKTFNRMTIRLKESIEREYVSQMNARKVELKMLQAQINPHFLYNTLNLISSIADLEGVEKISTISNSLSDMFRYNIKGKEIVPIKDEIEQIKNYLAIQELRFPNKFSVDYDMDPTLYKCCILKFLMQPIVENAVYHGIEQLKGEGWIRISVKQEGNDLLITIQDNGKGITPVQLTKIKDKIKEKREDSKPVDHEGSVGILNVHWRIQACYGQDFGLSIESEDQKGTTVHLVLPRIMDEERTV